MINKKISMVSCQEPSPLKGSKHSEQCHPHDAALVNALSFVSMGVETRCRPSKSAAHLRHMKRHPSVCHCCPHRGHRHCDRCCHLDRRRQFCRHRHCCGPLPLPSAIAVAVAINRCHRHLCCVAVSDHCRRRPCHRTLPSPSLSAIAVAIAVDHHRRHCCQPFPRVVALARQELYSTN
jgi:hypothetical protein